jgi:phenylpyruvate tautomerase PptA (4-oxalocrotonate tautomerase family)
MPHVVVRLWPGKSEQQKIRLAEEIVKDVIDVHGATATTGPENYRSESDDF